MDEILAAMDADELRVSESVSDLSGYDEEESTALLALMIQCVLPTIVGSVSNLWCAANL